MVRMTGREELTYSNNGLSIRMDCYYQPEYRAYTVVLQSQGTEDGKPRTLTPAEIVAVEERVRSYLAPRTFFGIRIGMHAVHFTRGQAFEA